MNTSTTKDKKSETDLSTKYIMYTLRCKAMKEDLIDL